MATRKIRPVDDLSALRSGSKWIVSFPGGREARYTDKEFSRYFAEVEFRALEDPDPMPRQDLPLWDRSRGIEIILPTTPGSVLRPNAGAHYKAWIGKQNREEKARVRLASKEAAEAALARIEAEIGSPLERPLFGDDARVEILVEWEKIITPRYKNGMYRPKVDPHDALPMMCKGIVDGLTDAGIIADDRRIRATYDQGKDPAAEGRVIIKVQGE